MNRALRIASVALVTMIFAAVASVTRGQASAKQNAVVHWNPIALDGILSGPATPV